MIIDLIKKSSLNLMMFLITLSGMLLLKIFLKRREDKS